jgi:hypothetical protein
MTDFSTYITKINNFTNGSAHIITGHSGQGIIEKNYHDKKAVQDVVANFEFMRE